MGILNITPDSFSDGGMYVDPQVAIEAGLTMVKCGAGLVDVGGESTRPGAATVAVEEEIKRILPVIEGLAGAGVIVSVDTSKPGVAEAAVAAGARVINDVTGFGSPDMARLAASRDVGAVVMHMKGKPRTMQDNPVYGDVVTEVGQFLRARADGLIAAGVSADSIVVDPGIGFGKTPAHNLELLNRLPEIVQLGYPVLLGTSRKSTLKSITGEPDPKARDGQTAITTALGFERGARIFRVHDVPSSRDALLIAAAIVAPQRWEEWQLD